MRAIVTLVLLSCLCAGAVYFDLHSRRIPNILNLAGFTAGILAASLLGGVACLASSVAGSLLGLSVLVVPFLLHMVGGGDVKFLAAAGAVVGWKILWLSFLAGAAIGGVLGLALIVISESSLVRIKHRLVLIQAGIWQRGLSVAKKEAGSRRREERMPYSIPMSAGLLLVTSMNLWS